MKKLIYKIGFLITLIAITITVFYSCKRENGKPQQNVNINSDVQSLKEEFTKQGYDVRLATKVNDSAFLYLQPQWGYTGKVIQDSVTYTFILLKPVIKIKDKIDTKQNVTMDGIEQYLLVTQYKNNIDFSIAKYMIDAGRVNELKSTKSIANKLAIQNLFKSFTGTLLVIGLKDNYRHTFNYVNNVIKPGNSLNINETNLKVNGLKTNDPCRNEYYCGYNSVCFNNWFITYTLSEGACACPSISYGQNCSTYNGTTCNSEWVKYDETIFVRNCNTQPTTNPPVTTALELPCLQSRLFIPLTDWYVHVWR